MTSYNYSVSSFYDFGCETEPIIVISSKTGCGPVHECQRKSDFNFAYAASSVSCFDTPVSMVNGTRDYVMKSLFVHSEDCSGPPLTQYVVAADYACHPNPQAGNDANNAYFQVSCNGFMPIWNSCIDNNCINCTAITATSPCMIGGAGTSNGYQCFKALDSSSTTTSKIGASPTSTRSDVFPTDALGPNVPSLAYKSVDIAPQNVWLLCTVILLLVLK